MFKRIKTAKAAWKAIGQYEEVKKEIDAMSNIVTLLKSKRLWVNVAGLLVTLGGVVPQKTGIVLIAAANLITKIIDMSSE